jgi:Phosphoenolpyruvate phosphomutase
VTALCKGRATPHTENVSYVCSAETIAYMSYHGSAFVTTAPLRVARNMLSHDTFVSSPRMTLDGGRKKSPIARFRALLAKDEILVMPCCYDALSARLIQRAGFPITFMSGFSVAASRGLPDTGLISYAGMQDCDLRCLSSPRNALAPTPWR